MINFAIQCIVWFIVLSVLMSFIEHQIHQHLMHRKSPLSVIVPNLNKVFEHHAVLHHGYYYDIFDDEPVAPGKDKGLRLNYFEGFLEALPIAAIIAIFSLLGAAMFFVVVMLHHFFWNKIHVEMHKPEKRFFSDWPLYKRLARHHYLHHRHRDKNFNVVLPIADIVLGTNARATRTDLKGMYNANLFSRRREPNKILSQKAS